MSEGDDDTTAWLQSADPPLDRVDPGRPTLENTIFVVLGALGTLFAVGRVAGLV